MPKITNIKARQVFDSRGLPTIESEIYLEDGSRASAIVPSGASTGTYEAFELRDIENKKYLGKSVIKAIEKVNGEISKWSASNFIPVKYDSGQNIAPNTKDIIHLLFSHTNE